MRARSLLCAGAASVALAFFCSPARPASFSGVSDGLVEIKDEPLALRRTIETEWAGDSTFVITVATLIRNGTTGTMTSVAIADSATNYIPGGRYTITSGVTKLSGPGTITANSSWTGTGAQTALLSGANSLTRGQVAILSYRLTVRATDADSIVSLGCTASGTSGGALTSSNLVRFMLPVEPQEAQIVLFRTGYSTYVSPTQSDFTMFTGAWNPAGCRLVFPAAIKDTTANYITGGGSSFSVTSAPTLVSSGDPDTNGPPNVIGNPSWNGTTSPSASYSDLAYLVAFEPGNFAVFQHTIRVTHGSFTKWSTRTSTTASAWGTYCLGPAISSCTWEATIPPPPGNPIIAASMSLGAITGSTGAYVLPVTIRLGNIGTDPAYRPNVRFPIASHLPATSALVSLSPITSRRGYTINPNYDGTTAHDSLLTGSFSEVLAAAGVDTLTLNVTFSEGNQNDWTTYARGFATNLIGTVTSDTTNCGVFDEDDDSNPNEPGENDACAFNVPDTGQPPTITSVWADKAGNAMFSVGLAQGVLPATTLTSGNGLALRSPTTGTALATQYAKVSASAATPTDPLRYCTWPDGTVRLVQLAAKLTAAGKWDVFTPSAAQTGAAVAVTEEPNFSITLEPTNYPLLRASMSAALPADGRVVRRSFIAGTNGAADYLGSPGAMQYRVYVDTWADGSLYSTVAVRNQKRATGWGSNPYYNAGEWGGDPASQAVCNVRFVRVGSSMRLRWAADMNLGDGTNTAEILAWNPSSYTHPNGGSVSFGGQFLAGQDLRFFIAEDQDPEPPRVLQSADDYIASKAYPWTDTLVKHRGAAWTSADSLLSVAEHHIREWSYRVQEENPPAAWWKSPLMFGNQYRQFDGHLGTAIDACRGGSQYETDLEQLKFLMSISQVSADSLMGYDYVAAAWKSVVQQVHMDWQSAYNVDYDPEPHKNGVIFPHTEHGTTGIGNQGRSSQKPTLNYQHGLALLPVMYMTCNPLLAEDWDRHKTQMAYRVSRIGISNDEFSGGEGRQQANLINWSWMIADFEPTAQRWTDLNACIANVSNRWSVAWNDDPRILGCNSRWKWQKPWQLVYEAVGLQQAERVQTRWAQTSAASTTYALWQNLAQHTRTYQTGSRTVTIRDTNCQNPFPAVLKGMYYQDGIKPCCFPACEGCDDDDVCVDFWNTLAAGCVYPIDPAYGDELMRGCVRNADEGSYNCPFSSFGTQYYQKQGIIGLWYMEWAKARGY